MAMLSAGGSKNYAACDRKNCRCDQCAPLHRCPDDNPLPHSVPRTQTGPCEGKTKSLSDVLGSESRRTHSREHTSINFFLDFLLRTTLYMNHTAICNRLQIYV